ncbi:MAG: TIGR02444 family protein [Cellvibrionaceae bacterium]
MDNLLTPNTSDSDHLWSFACEVYSNSSVAEACLALQDRYDVDVPLLLFCCWAGRDYGELPKELLQQALSFTKAWSSNTTKPLRAIRRDMKTSYSPQWPVSDTDWSDLREQVKRAELASEKLMLDGLSRLILDSSYAAGAEHSGIVAAVLNIKYCFQFSSASNSTQGNGMPYDNDEDANEGGAKVYLIDILSIAFNLERSEIAPLL